MLGLTDDKAFNEGVQMYWFWKENPDIMRPANPYCAGTKDWRFWYAGWARALYTSTKPYG